MFSIMAQKPCKVGGNVAAVPPRNPNRDEWVRRARAAAEIVNVDYKELAKQLGKSVSTLEREEAAAMARSIAHQCKLPYEFFTADFRLLEADTARRTVESLSAALAIANRRPGEGDHHSETTGEDAALGEALAALGHEPGEEEKRDAAAGQSRTAHQGS
jgi:hypothetical protein